MNKLIVILIPVFFIGALKAQDASEIIKKAYDKERGISSRGEMSMTIVRPTWQRTLKFKYWAKGQEYSLTLITYPAKEKGQSFLKRQNDLWSWNPTISKMIKLPASMMSQGWMGSDYSNDDILKESSIVMDYSHKIVGSSKIENYDCYLIEMIPKPSANIVWGKLIKWISKNDYLQLKTEYYDEEGYKVKSEIGKHVKLIGGRLLPTTVEIIPEDEPGKRTLVELIQVEFDIKIDESFFSQQNMQKIR